MATEFNRSKLDEFLGIIRKYMQMRGNMSQKELAEATETGVSTMSRFLNQQTKEINPQMIARIVAELAIPLHEMIDFVEENYADHFIRLVKFYKGEPAPPQSSASSQSTEDMSQDEEDGLAEALGPARAGNAQRSARANISVGGKSRTLTFSPEGEGDFRDKLKSLTARQKGFLHDFLNLDMDGRDLVVDIGKNIISYLRQKGIDF